MFRIYQNGVPVQWTLKTEDECKEWIKRSKKQNLDLQRRYGAMMIINTVKYTYKEEV